MRSADRPRIRGPHSIDDPLPRVELAYCTSDKMQQVQQVDQGAIVENKRLGAALA